MTNNEILRRIQHALNLKNAQIIKAFEQADSTVAHDQVNNWLKAEGENAWVIGEIAIAAENEEQVEIN